MRSVESATGSRIERRQLVIASEAAELSAELVEPDQSVALLVLAHGAGAGYRHRNMRAISEALAQAGVASLRFNFPFTQQGRRRVDSQATATRAIADAWKVASELRLALPMFLGGHSFGGRMVSHAVLEHPIQPRGLVFCAYPLHPAGKPGRSRAAHLAEITFPMLFVSGTRDALASPALLRESVSCLGDRGSLYWLEDADHGYRTRQSVRRDTRSVFQEIAQEVRRFVLAQCL